MTTVVSSSAKHAMRFGWRVAGGYLVIMIGGLLFSRLLRTMLDCRIATGIDLGCTLFGIDVGSPLVPAGVAMTLILYAWPLVALVCAISFMLAAALWLLGRLRARGGT